MPDVTDARLHCGDCLDFLRTLPEGSVDAVVADPPYGTRADRDGYGRRQKWAGRQHIAGDEDLSTFAAMLPEARRLLKPNAWLVFFCSPKRRDDVGAVCRSADLRILGEVVWDKRTPGLGGGIRYQHETVLLCSFGKASGRCQLPSVVSEWVSNGGQGNVPRHHPHQKPPRLMASLVRYATREGDVALDPFMGSGTTGVACVQTGRNFIGCEIDPAYFAVAEKRIAEGRGVGGLFAASESDAPTLFSPDAAPRL